MPMDNFVLEPALASRQEKRGRMHRDGLRRTWIGAAFHGMNILLIAAFAYLGSISYPVLITLAAFSLLSNALILGGIYSGLTRCLHDPLMPLFQMGNACAINLLAMVLAPQLAYVFAINLFVALAFATLHFNRRQYLVAWSILSCLIGIIFLNFKTEITITALAPIERLLTWIITTLALGCYMVINFEVSGLRRQLQSKNAELTAATKMLTELASSDELTGICNRREFLRLLQDEIRRSQRSNAVFCVTLIDADHFKQVNDRFGHAVGDRTLIAIARILQQSLRGADACARYGGEEFTVLAVNTSAFEAAVQAERLRQNIAQYDWNTCAPGLQVTISAGIAAWNRSETADQLLHRADNALYQAKKTGRNCVQTAH